MEWLKPRETNRQFTIQHQTIQKPKETKVMHATKPEFNSNHHQQTPTRAQRQTKSMRFHLL